MCTRKQFRTELLAAIADHQYISTVHINVLFDQRSEFEQLVHCSKNRTGGESYFYLINRNFPQTWILSFLSDKCLRVTVTVRNVLKSMSVKNLRFPQQPKRSETNAEERNRRLAKLGGTGEDQLLDSHWRRVNVSVCTVFWSIAAATISSDRFGIREECDWN